MVAGEHDHGVVGEAEPVERGDYAADLRVHEADARGIRLPAVAAKVVGEVVLFGLGAAERRGRQIGLIGRDTGDYRHLLAGVEIEIKIFRGHKGSVGPEEADGEKEGSALVGGTQLEHLLGLPGDEAVGVFVIGGGRGVPGERAAILPGREREDSRFLLQSIDAGGIARGLPTRRGEQEREQAGSHEQCSSSPPTALPGNGHAYTKSAVLP
jgi:hypothetical protein